MADVLCAKCGESWDYYGVFHGDMEPEEARRFLKGEGCPRCQMTFEAMISETEVSDEDPILIMNRRGF